jgi:hypothetical protein
MMEEWKNIEGIEEYLTTKALFKYKKDKANETIYPVDTWDPNTSSTIRRIAKFRFFLMKTIYIDLKSEQKIKKESVKDIAELFNRLCESDDIYRVLGNFSYMKLDSDKLGLNKYAAFVVPLVWDDIEFKDNDLFVQECSTPRVVYYQDYSSNCTCTGWQLFHIGCNCGWLNATKKS